MEFSGLGGGIMVALAAGLWLVYLMPTLFKRREYVAAQHTEVRRQQALRILQETQPMPAVQRVEAIVSPSGEVTDRDKLAEAIKRSREAQAARMARGAIAQESTAPAREASVRARVSKRIRRTRALAALLLLTAALGVLVQLTLMVTTGVAMGAWAVLGFAGVLGVVSVAALGRLATMSRRRATVAPPEEAVRPMRQRVIEEREATRPPVSTWTPIAVPRPMYLTRADAAPLQVLATVDAVEQLRVAAMESDRALREAQESPEVTSITSSNRYASMGIIDRSVVEGTDLDEVLRRRRKAS